MTNPGARRARRARPRCGRESNAGHDTEPGQVRAALAAQHDDLRNRIARCEALADRVDAGSTDIAPLLEEVQALRRALADHNQLEERVLPHVLLDAGWVGEASVARMARDHAEEHRDLQGELDATRLFGLRGVLASLHAHLDVEDQQLVIHRRPRRPSAR